MLAAVVLVAGPVKNAETQMSDNQETLAGMPIACFEILGQSALHRTLERMKDAGADFISVIADERFSECIHKEKKVELSFVRDSEVWQATMRRLAEYVANGVTTLFLIRLGAYVEFDLVDLLQFHHKIRYGITRIYDHRGPLDIWVMDSDRSSIKPAALLDREYKLAAPYFVRGYVNRLSNAQDIRRLVVDAFLSRCNIKPDGAETRPGVWVAEGAQLDSSARVVAPAYVGKNAKLSPSSVVTRFSNIEHSCHVDYGTVVEDSTALADTYLGAGLDVSHTVVFQNTLAHLRENVVVEINDKALIGATAPLSMLNALMGKSNQPKRISDTQTASIRSRRIESVLPRAD